MHPTSPVTEPAAQKVCQNEKTREAWYAVGIRDKYVLRRQYKRQYEHGNNFKNNFEYGFHNSGIHSVWVSEIELFSTAYFTTTGKEKGSELIDTVLLIQ